MFVVYSRDSLKRHIWNLEEVWIRGLGPDKNHPCLSRYEEFRNESGVVLNRGFSASKPHAHAHIDSETRYIEI